MVALSAAGLWLLLKDLLPWARVFGPSALFGVVFLAFSLALGLWLVRRLLRPVQAPPRPGTWLAVMWGGLAACGIAQLLNGVLLSAWSRALDLETAASWAPALTAPINEELAKAAGVVMLTAVSASLVRGAADGFVLGALVGLGFQVSENLSYGFLQILAFGGVDPLAATQQAAMVRFLLTGIGSHWAMTAVAGAGIGYLAGAVGRPPAGRIAAFIGCLLLAMGMHWAFDAPVLDGFLDPVGKPLLNFLIALVVYLSVRRRFRARWQAVADEEVAAGTMGADEAAALSRRRSRARARRRVPAGPQRETAARVQRAQLDLVEARVPGDLAVEDAQPLREAVADARRGDPARR
nr:PrsW family intramembrane metalloprotease [Glycomyces amatae]